MLNVQNTHNLLGRLIELIHNMKYAQGALGIQVKFVGSYSEWAKEGLERNDTQKNEIRGFVLFI